MSRTVTRGLTAIVLGVLTSLTMISPAHADTCPPGTYPPGVGCTPVAITVTTATAGQDVTLTMSGFGAGSAVTFAITCASGTGGNLGTFNAGSTGSVTATVKIPSSCGVGVATITASGTGANGAALIQSASLTIKAAAGGGLPFTGFQLGAASLLGTGLLVAGAIAIVSGRKRKTGLATA